MLYRRHRGALKESMKTVVEVDSKEMLIDLIKEDYKGFDVIDVSFGDDIYDERTGWHTFQVLAHFKKRNMEPKIIVGFSNGIL